jgi:hypothetical protein
MKINFQHPVTKKPSSVILPDIWLKSWFRATLAESSDLPSFVAASAEDWYCGHAAACDALGYFPATFTQYCESLLANDVYELLDVALMPSDIHQSRLIATPSNAKAVSRSEIKKIPLIQSNL